MNRLRSVMLLLVLVAVSSSSQVSVGIKGGVNFATIAGADADPNAKTLTRYAAGLYWEISVPFLFTIQPEVLYSTKGSAVDQAGTFLNPPSTNTTNLAYIEVPVLIKYTFPVPVLKPSLYAGPDVGFLLSAKIKREPSGLSSSETDVKDQTSGTDWGIALGASANLLIATLDVRYTLGLTSLDKNGSAKVYNRVWSLMVQFPIQ